MAIVTELQKQMKIEQADRGSYEPSHQWNMDEILAMRKKYITIANEKNLTPDDMFGKKGTLSQENHNCGVAYGWGGFTSDQAVYLNYIPKNDTPCTLTCTVTACQAVGSVTIHFGGDNKDVPNYLEIFPGWTFILRIYLPQEAYFNKTWVKPELEY